MEVQRKRTKVKKKKAKPLDGTGYVDVEITKEDKAPAVTKRDDIDDLLPKLPEVGTAGGSTTEEAQEKQENTEQADVRQDQEELTSLVITQPVETADSTADKTPEVESVAVTTLVDEEISRLLPSIEELAVSRTEENVVELRTEGDVASEQTHLTTVQDVQQPEAVVESTGLPDVLEEEQQQQQQQQQQEQQQHIERQQQEVIATLEVSESVEVVPKPMELTTTGVTTELPAMPAYPCFDNLIAVETTDIEDTVPYNEEELAALYPNPQLDANEQFIDYFIKASQQDQHELYKLLMIYLKQRQSLVVLQCQVEDLRSAYERQRDRLWRVENKTISTQGRCADNSDVSHQHTFNIAVFDRSSLNEVKSTLKSLRKLLEEELCLKLYSSQLSRIHIQYYLYKLCYAIPSVSAMPADAPVACIFNAGFTSPDIAKLRDCISVLFMFERRPVEDKEFKADCRQWLDMLLSVLLRVASLQDHQFILNHLLRCPPGVASWGTKYMQLITPQALTEPAPQFIGAYDMQEGMGEGLHRDWGSPLLDHFVTMLATLTMPIKQRDDFLSMMGVTKSSEGAQPSASAQWTLIGEDLEEELEEDKQLLLKEADFMDFFDQFPFNDVFQHILQISDNEEYRPELTSSYSMMRLIAFCMCLIKLLGTAFSTLRLQRYKEFNKRVGRCIRLIVQYVADHWLAYRSYQLQLGLHMNQFPDTVIANEPRYTLNRLQLEMDCFILRATKWILIGHKLGAWQFMADMPYSVVSVPMMWHIFFVLYTNVTATAPDQVCDVEVTKRKLKDTAVREQFVDRMMRNLTSETVFLLTTFVNMATCCGSDSAEEIEFISTIALELFECTQLVEFARDAYADTGSSLLDSIAVVHPFTISSLIHKTRDNIGVAGENCLMVFKKLPLHLWTPTAKDMEVIREWLIDFPLKSHENALAMLILENMNWGTKNEAELALDYSLHKMVALLLVEAHSRHLPTHPGGVDYNSGLNPELSLSKFMTIGSGIKEEQAKFSHWTWEVSLMLKLHPMQQPSPILQPVGMPLPAQAPPLAKMLQPLLAAAQPDVNALMANLPSLEHQELLEIRNAVERSGLLASYLAFCLSHIGSDTDAFLEVGLPLLQQLVDQGYILPATRILANITPRFFGQEKVLIRNPKFTQILFRITNADYQHASSVDKLTKSHTAVYMRNLLALIQTQIHRASAPGNSIGDMVLKFWLTLFTSYPNWYREQCLLYLLDGLSQVSFKYPKWQAVIWDSLITSYAELQQTQPQKSGLLSTLMYLWGQEGELPSLFRLVSPKEFPWLAYDALSAEQLYEEREGYWSGLLKQFSNNRKITMDAALKRTLVEMRKPSGAYLCNHYCIFRWASFASELDPSHPLLPLVWQRFFKLYLQRPMLNPGNAERESYGKRLLESYGHVKKLKTSLSSTVAYHQQQAQSEDVEESSPDKEYHRNMAKVYQTFIRWLEEPLLHESTVHLPSLPPQYDATRLSQLFQSDNGQPWLDLVPMWKIEKDTLELVSDWVKAAAYQKQKPFVSHSKTLDPETAGNRILKRLRKRVETVKPPPLVVATNPLPVISEQIYSSPQLLVTSVKLDVTLILQEARNFSVKTSAMLLLDEEYFDLVPKLYQNEPRQFHVSVPCRRRFNRNHRCAGPANLVFRFEELVNVTSCQRQAEQNRGEHKQIIGQLKSCVSHELCTIVVKFEHIINELIRLANQQSNEEAADAAITLFYEITRCVSVESKQFGPSSQFFTSVIEILGQEFIQKDPTQIKLLLDTMTTAPNLCGLLAPLFTPNISPDQFLEMYNATLQLAVKEGATIAFQLLTKFNVTEWLSTNIGTSRQGELLDTVCYGLSMCGCNATDGADILLEIYRRHFREVLRFKFPKYYFDALKLILQGTDRVGISAACWQDMLSCLQNVNTESSDTIQTTLTLQQLQETVGWLGDHFTVQRRNNTSLYSSYTNYIQDLAEFTKFIFKALCARLSSIVEVHNITIDEAIATCWSALLKVHEAWVTTITTPDNPVLLHPWQDYEAPLAERFVGGFVDCVIAMQQCLKTSNYSNSPISLAWIYYCEHLSLANKEYVFSVYHDQLTKLPWEEFYPDLSSIEYMIKLKVNYHQSLSFLFLGEISSQINWLALVKLYSNTEPEADKVATLNRLHGLLLHLFVMLSNEAGKMSNSEDIFHLLHKAHDFYWQYLDNNYFTNVTEWLKIYGECSLIISSGSSLSASLRLLKVAAGFPSQENLSVHSDAPGKRKNYIALLVELVSKCSYLPDIERHRYKEIISHMLQVMVETALADITGKDVFEVVKMLEELFNLLNICNHADNVVNEFIKIIHSIYDDLPNIQMISLPSITAATRILASIPTMVDVIEKSIESFFTGLAKPSDMTAPPESTGFGWYSVTGAMLIPETIMAEFRSTCIEKCACLTLHAMLLQSLPTCKNYVEERKTLSTIIDWCIQIKLNASNEYKLLLLWEKALGLLLRQARMQGSSSDLVNNFTTVVQMLVKIGEDKASEGFLGAIGLGKKSPYSFQFRLIARALAAFICVQMPVDTSHITQLRLTPNAPGHIKEHSRGGVTPAKQAEQAYASLESLLSNKQYAKLKEHVHSAFLFMNDAGKTLMNVMDLFIHLVASLYTEYRSLDLLRIQIS